MKLVDLSNEKSKKLLKNEIIIVGYNLLNFIHTTYNFPNHNLSNPVVVNLLFSNRNYRL
jgi:hypothetical protein